MEIQANSIIGFSTIITYCMIINFPPNQYIKLMTEGRNKSFFITGLTVIALRQKYYLTDLGLPFYEISLAVTVV